MVRRTYDSLESLSLWDIAEYLIATPEYFTQFNARQQPTEKREGGG
jgi:hypothetical protein